MVKTIGINGSFEEATVVEVLEYFKHKKEVEVDVETTGFDPYTVELLCLQIGDYDNQFVIHPDYVHHFKEFLESKTLLGHNIKFDLLFLYYRGIWPNKVFDTFLAESVLYCGIKLHKKALNAVAKRRIDVDLDKSVRDNIWKEGLTDRVIQYAADDVKYLSLIKESQLKEAKEKDLIDAIDLENRFTLVLAYIEFCGIKLDEDKWKTKMLKDEDKKVKAEQDLDNYVITNNISPFINTQGDLFSPQLTTNINWSSSRQVVKLFKHLEIPVKVKKKGKESESVDAKVITKHSKTFPIVPIYLQYKESEKVVSTYGQSFLNQINPKTNRIHTRFRQIMDTGRISSGGRNKATNESYSNLQNLPSDAETRSCFVAEEGNTLIVADYSGQEQIVLANRCLDRNLLEFYDQGLGDMHAYIASKMFPHLADVSLKDIKNNHKEERQESKIAGFVVNYGGSAENIAEQLNKSIEDGIRVFNSYFEAFPGLKDYFEKSKKEGLKNGYVLIDKVIRRKSYINTYKQYKTLKNEITPQFWDTYKAEKAKFQEGLENNFAVYKEKVSTYFKIKGAIERKSLNYSIQGTAANITKESGINIFNWIKSQKLLNVVKFVNQVHDENILECPETMAEKVATATKKAMLDAGAIYCQRVPLKADPEITPIWQK